MGFIQSEEDMTTTIPTPTGMNAVDIHSVAALANKCAEAPEVAATVWKASVTWDEGFRSSAKIRDFDPVASDEPTSLGGGDTAPNPVEQLLASLGNCLVVGYAANATAVGIEIKSLSIELEGDLDLRTFLGLDPDGNAGYEAIRVKVDLDSDATPDQVAQLHETVVGTSPVGHSLSLAVPVTIDMA